MDSQDQEDDVTQEHGGPRGTERLRYFEAPRPMWSHRVIRRRDIELARTIRDAIELRPVGPQLEPGE